MKRTLVTVPKPTHKVKMMKVDHTSKKDFVKTMISCTNFSLKHHNAEEHIHAYVANICERGENDVWGEFLLWLASLHELD